MKTSIDWDEDLDANVRAELPDIEMEIEAPPLLYGAQVCIEDNSKTGVIEYKGAYAFFVSRQVFIIIDREVRQLVQIKPPPDIDDNLPEVEPRKTHNN